jgi:hypothetical protein
MLPLTKKQNKHLAWFKFYYVVYVHIVCIIIKWKVLRAFSQNLTFYLSLDTKNNTII